MDLMTNFDNLINASGLDNAAIDRLRNVFSDAQNKMEKLTHELAYYRRIRYGRTREAFNVNSPQLSLFEEVWDEDVAAIEAEVQKISKYANKPRAQAGRQALPKDLPRIEYRHEPESKQCQNCQRDLVLVREDITEKLDVEPAQFFVQRHIRPQYACRCCEQIISAPTAPAIIEGGLASEGLLAWIAIQKFADHLPLYRIHQIAQRSGVNLATSTLASWVGQTGVALQPLADRLAELLKQNPVLHADETPVQQLDPGSGKTKRAYLWAYRSNDLDAAQHRIIVFDYQTSRSGVHAQAFLDQWQGHLMVDDYAGYKALFKDNVTELACLAHMRRKFFDVYCANNSSIAEQALAYINELYAIEKDGVNLNAHARLELRQQRALPIVRTWHNWLNDKRKNTAPGSAIFKAIEYSLKRWTAFERYVHNGLLPIDNNPAENSIRPIAIGKKNWLFAGSQRAGIRAAAIQSLIATAKLNGLDPYAWLKSTLEKLPTHPNHLIDELLPFNSNPSS